MLTLKIVIGVLVSYHSHAFIHVEPLDSLNIRVSWGIEIDSGEEGSLTLPRQEVDIYILNQSGKTVDAWRPSPPAAAA